MLDNFRDIQPVERVKVGLRNARAKRKKLGRPRVVVDRVRIRALRAQGRGWKKIAAELGIGSVRFVAQRKKSLDGFRKPILLPLTA